jgi:hypothetical protein
LERERGKKREKQKGLAPFREAAATATKINAQGPTDMAPTKNRRRRKRFFGSIFIFLIKKVEKADRK